MPPLPEHLQPHLLVENAVQVQDSVHSSLSVMRPLRSFYSPQNDVRYFAHLNEEKFNAEMIHNRVPLEKAREFRKILVQNRSQLKPLTKHTTPLSMNLTSLERQHKYENSRLFGSGVNETPRLIEIDGNTVQYPPQVSSLVTVSESRKYLINSMIDVIRESNQVHSLFQIAGEIIQPLKRINENDLQIVKKNAEKIIEGKVSDAFMDGLRNLSELEFPSIRFPIVEPGTLPLVPADLQLTLRERRIDARRTNKFKALMKRSQHTTVQIQKELEKKNIPKRKRNNLKQEIDRLQILTDEWDGLLKTDPMQIDQKKQSRKGVAVVLPRDDSIASSAEDIKEEHIEWSESQSSEIITTFPIDGIYEIHGLIAELESWQESNYTDEEIRSVLSPALINLLASKSDTNFDTYIWSKRLLDDDILLYYSESNENLIYSLDYSEMDPEEQEEAREKFETQEILQLQEQAEAKEQAESEEMIQRTAQFQAEEEEKSRQDIMEPIPIQEDFKTFERNLAWDDQKRSFDTTDYIEGLSNQFMLFNRRIIHTVSIRSLLESHIIRLSADTVRQQIRNYSALITNEFESNSDGVLHRIPNIETIDIDDEEKFAENASLRFAELDHPIPPTNLYNQIIDDAFDNHLHFDAEITGVDFNTAHQIPVVILRDLEIEEVLLVDNFMQLNSLHNLNEGQLILLDRLYVYQHHLQRGSESYGIRLLHTSLVTTLINTIVTEAALQENSPENRLIDLTATLIRNLAVGLAATRHQLTEYDSDSFPLMSDIFPYESISMQNSDEWETRVNELIVTNTETHFSEAIPIYFTLPPDDFEFEEEEEEEDFLSFLF